MGHAAPLPFLPAPDVSRPAPEARFDLNSLVGSAPRERRAQRAVAPGVLSFAAHVIAVAAIIVLPLVLGEVSLPVASEAVHAFFVPPPDVALPPPPPPPPAVARALTPAPTAPPVTEATFLAPIEMPEGVQPEEGIDLGVEGGVPGGVEGGVPGGVTGGVVGGLPEAPPPPTVTPVRVGGMVRVPQLLNRVTPAYPAIAVAARTSAILVLEATVGADGRVQEVKVLRGQPLFDQAAVDAVKQWRYRPLLLNGVPVPFIVTVTLSFSVVNQGA
jgi:periplasmic protein TonB